VFGDRILIAKLHQLGEGGIFPLQQLNDNGFAIALSHSPINDTSGTIIDLLQAAIA